MNQALIAENIFYFLSRQAIDTLEISDECPEFFLNFCFCSRSILTLTILRASLSTILLIYDGV
jgi:hypothetical protein